MIEASDSKERLKATLSECPSIKSWSRDGNPQVYVDVLSPDIDQRDDPGPEWWSEIRPYILIYDGPEKHQLVASPATYAVSGSLVAMFEQNTPAGPYSDEELSILFTRFIKSVTADIKALARLSQHGWVLPTSITTDGPFRASHEQAIGAGDCQQYYIEFEWGTLA